MKNEIANRKWIALSGKAGCGKSTIADIMEKEYGFIRLSFAKRLKEICNELFPELMSQSKNDARWVLQKFGTDYCRRIKSTVWIDIITKPIDEWNKKYLIPFPWENWARIIVDDCRFYNEYFALKSRRFKMVRIHRAKELVEPFGYDTKDPHASETQLDTIPAKDWDLVLQNDFEYPFKEAAEIIAKTFGVNKK